MDYYDASSDLRPKGGLRIGFIKREKRRMLNHKEIIEQCNKGIVNPAGGSVECISLNFKAMDVTTMELVRSLNFFVGVHGSGLLNGIFLNSGTGVLELFPVRSKQWMFSIYREDYSWLHYEGLHFCNLSLTEEVHDRRWQTTSQIYPWEHVQRRLQNLVNHLGDVTYPAILERVPYTCDKGSVVVFSKGQLSSLDGRSVSHEYLGLSLGTNWTVKTAKE